jgi:glycosyltransferase involved in cell wall biosynthesis
MNVLSTDDYRVNTSKKTAQFELLIGLKKRGVNIIVVSLFSNEILQKFKDADITCIEDFPESKIDLNYVKNIKKYVEEYKIDIIHAFHGKALRNTILAVKKSPIKLITYMGSSSIHWHDPSAYFTYLSPRIDKIICNSNYVYEHVKKQLFGKRKQKAIKIFKGYNPDWFSNIQPFDFSTLGIDKNATVVCFAADYLKVKGVEYYIKSTYHIDTKQNIHFILLGDMRGNKDVPKLIKNSPLKNNIHALGSRKDAISFFKAADIYVQTSKREGFGRAISEAMCLKKPIIMTNAGGCTELIDEHSGIVVPVKQPKAIAEAIVKLAQNKELSKKMGENAFVRINEKFHIDKTIQETLELYKSL